MCTLACARAHTHTHTIFYSPLFCFWMTAITEKLMKLWLWKQNWDVRRGSIVGLTCLAGPMTCLVRQWTWRKGSNSCLPTLCLCCVLWKIRIPMCFQCVFCKLIRIRHRACCLLFTLHTNVYISTTENSHLFQSRLVAWKLFSETLEMLETQPCGV